MHQQDGGGFCDHIEVEAGMTVAQLFAQRVKQGSAADYLIRVKRQPVAGNHVLQDGDRLSFTPTKLQGAA